MTQTASVLTIAKGRAAHLHNVMLGLAAQTVLPREFIIAHMQPEPYADLPEMPFPVIQIAVEGELALARARNMAAARASGDLLVFLDVDCIPAPTLVADYTAHDYAGVLMGEVLYLPAGATARDWCTDDFADIAVKHSDRQGPPTSGIEPCTDYRCFWSLNFALRADIFSASQRFDERFTGYGGEDTDFGKSLSMAGTSIGWIAGARVYHQHHTHHMPPLHHLESVVRNAELFAEKWGYRTMEHWLYAFMLMGLIDNSGPKIRILRQPGPEHVALTRQEPHQPYVNTASVIRTLKAKLSEDAGQKALLRPGIAAE